MTIKIAGNKTITDWNQLKPSLLQNPINNDAWKKALEFFDLRINNRYIFPADAVRSAKATKKLIGEGFTICTILCSLIEALETFYQGLSFSNNPQNQYEYGNRRSREIFTSFLCNRDPFSDHFGNDTDFANDFYSNVRCSLLHEAATSNGWKINIEENETIVRKGTDKIINRSLFLSDIKKYIKSYKKAVFNDRNLRAAFIRKFEGICRRA